MYVCMYVCMYERVNVRAYMHVYPLGLNDGRLEDLDYPNLFTTALLRSELWRHLTESEK